MHVPILRIFAACATLLTAAQSATAQTSASAPVPAAGAPVAPAPSADTAASGSATKGEILAARQFKWLDANGDGYLSRDEVALFPRLRDAFDQADADRDNRVSFGEIRALALQRRAERGSASPTPESAAPAEPSTAAPSPPPAAPAPPSRW